MDRRSFVGLAGKVAIVLPFVGCGNQSDADSAKVEDAPDRRRERNYIDDIVALQEGVSDIRENFKEISETARERLSQLGPRVETVPRLTAAEQGRIRNKVQENVWTRSWNPRGYTHITAFTDKFIIPDSKERTALAVRYYSEVTNYLFSHPELAGYFKAQKAQFQAPQEKTDYTTGWEGQIFFGSMVLEVSDTEGFNTNYTDRSAQGQRRSKERMTKEVMDQMREEGRRYENFLERFKSIPRSYTAYPNGEDKEDQWYIFVSTSSAEQILRAPLSEIILPYTLSAYLKYKEEVGEEKAKLAVETFSEAVSSVVSMQFCTSHGNHNAVDVIRNVSFDKSRFYRNVSQGITFAQRENGLAESARLVFEEGFGAYMKAIEGK